MSSWRTNLSVRATVCISSRAARRCALYVQYNPVPPHIEIIESRYLIIILSHWNSSCHGHSQRHTPSDLVLLRLRYRSSPMGPFHFHSHEADHRQDRERLISSGRQETHGRTDRLNTDKSTVSSRSQAVCVADVATGDVWLHRVVRSADLSTTSRLSTARPRFLDFLWKDWRPLGFERVD